MTRSSLEHPMTIHFVVGSSSPTCCSFSPTANTFASERGDVTGAGEGMIPSQVAGGSPVAPSPSYA